MSNVPTNLIPTRITQLPEYTGTSTLGYMPYVIDGRTFKVQFTNIAAVGAVPSTRVIATGDGLEGGGDLSADRTLSIIPHGVGYSQLDFTGVVAGTYGGADTIPAVTIDATGRVTAIVDTPVVLTNYVPTSRTVTAGSGLTGGGQLNSDITLALDPSNATPQPLGAASAGIGLLAAREDHVHPAVDLTDTTETQGVLPLGRGGTGDALSPVVGAVIYADNDSLNQTIAGNAGQLLTSAGGSGAPFWQTLVAGTGIVITQGSGTITVNASGGGGTVTSVSGTGTVNGISLTGTVTTSGSLTLGGTLSGVSLTTQVSGTLPVANGGTGQTTYTDGQLLIGNTTGNTLAKATLTAGSGITITNGPGSITIDATGGGTGTVTSVGLSGGTTGLTATSSTTNPITNSGTFTIGGTLNVANGGTGATNATDARANLVAAKSGANSDITSMSGITGGISLVDNLDFDTTSVVAGAVGRLVWNDGDGTLDLGLKGGNVTLQVGQEEVQRSFNEAGVGIVEGNIVYVSGAQGNRIAVSIAQANAAATSTGTIGMATENIANGAEGFITTQGLVRKLNTILDSEGNALAEGDLLYLSATVLGGYTKIEPAEPNFAVFVGYVVRVSATVGSIFIRPNVYPSIGEINKVSIVSTASGNTLIYDAVAGYYKTNTLTAGTNVSITNGPGSVTINATDQFVGTVTSVGGTGTVNGITLTGTVTSSGSLTLGGTLSGVSLTSQVTGTLPVANGGTGVTTSTGTGSVVLSTSPSLTTPSLGVASATSIATGLGAVGTPAYTFTGDLNTGIWSPAADTVAVSTGGAERMRIDSAGFVGIGTSAPVKLVHVANGDQAQARIRIQNTGASGRSYDLVSGIDAVSQSGFSLYDATASATRLIVDATGNVGIGNTPSGTYKLEVTGAAYASSMVLGAALPVASGGTGVTTSTGTGSTVLSTAPALSGVTLNDGYTEEVFAVTGTTPALSPTNGSIQTWTLTASSTPTAGTWADGQSMTLMINDGTAYTVTWTSLAVTWKTDGGVAPTLNLTGFTVIQLWEVGSVIYGARVGNA